MGRLRKGQSLLLIRLEKGEAVFPPLPPTRYNSTTARAYPCPNPRNQVEGSDAETITVQFENEEKVELPTRLLKRRANNQSKPLTQTKKPGGRGEEGDVETINMQSENEEEVELPTRLLKRRANNQSKPLTQTKKPAETVNMQSENEKEVELPTQLLKCRANSQRKPLPRTKKPGGWSEGGDAETVNMKSNNEEEVELPPPLVRCRANSQSESLPQTKKPGGRNEGGDAETTNMQSENEEEVELPPSLQRHRESSQSEPLPQTKKPGGRSEGGEAKTVNMQSENEEEVELPPPLLRLHCIPNTTLNKNQLPEIIHQAYASAAESVKKALVSELKSWDNFDVESMVDLANDAFASLASLHADFDGLYNSVRDFILNHWQLSEAKKELRMKGCLQKMKAHHSGLCDQSDKAHKALLGAQISLAKTEKLVTPLVNEIVEIRELLNDLEEKLKKGNEKIGAWQEECDRLEKSYEDAKGKEQNSAKQVAEHKRILELINSRHDKAMADIERTKVLLSSMCELNNDHS